MSQASGRGKGRGHGASRRTHQQAPRTSTEAMGCGQAQPESEIPRAVRQGLQDGRPARGVETGPSKRRRSGAGREDHPGHRGARRRGVPEGDSGRPEGEGVLAGPCEAAVHPEAGWEAAAAGNPDDPGPCGPDGGEAGDRADLRGGLRGVQLRIPAEEERDTSTRSDSRNGQRGLQLGGGRGHREVLRYARPHAADGSGTAADQRSSGAEADPEMAQGRCDGRRSDSRHRAGHPARRSDFAAVVEHLPCPAGSALEVSSRAPRARS